MSGFLCEKRILCYDTAGPTPDDARDASFPGPSRDPNQKADMGSRAPEAAEIAAQKEQPASQPGNAKATKHCK